MKVTFEQLVDFNNRDWMAACIMRALTKLDPESELIKSAHEKRFLEVKLLINGQEFEPTLINDVMQNIQEYISKKAETLAAEKFSQMYDSITDFHNLLKDFEEQQRKKFGLPIDEDHY